MLVKDVMNHAPLVMKRDESIQHAIVKMFEQQESCLVVVEGSCPIGILTERDVTALCARLLGGENIESLRLSDVMTPNPVSVHDNTPYADALTLSRSRNLRHLPVLDRCEKIVGVVTQANLLDAYAVLIEKQARLEDSIEELKLLSLIDPLTNLGNRRAMEVDLNFTEAEARRHGKSYAIGLFDIDYFKRFNDHYGHLKGDKVLRQVAGVVKDNVREYDRVYRYGGEEILVLMPETDRTAAEVCAVRICEALQNQKLENKNTPLGILTISGGVCASGSDSWLTMVKQADEALYAAKEGGRNRIEVAKT